VAILIDRSPEIVPGAVDGEEDLIEVPCVAGTGAPAAELTCIGLPKLPTLVRGRGFFKG
jgi:hypothetical protein